MANDDEDRRSTTDNVLFTVLGLADLALSQVKHALRPVNDVIQRSDLHELTRDGHDELTARGALAINRYASAPEPHLDSLAKAAARRSASGDA